MENVLSNADYTRMQTALARIEQQMEILDKAERTGFDMSEPKAILEAYKTQIEQLKREFLPGKA